jgi:hypothetical protein
MGEIVISELAAMPVFEPFFADLVSTDVEVPDFRGNAFEVLIFIDINALLVFYIPGVALIDQVATGDGVAGDKVG